MLLAFTMVMSFIACEKNDEETVVDTTITFERISFDDDGYHELVNAIGDAIDKQQRMDGAQVTDNTLNVEILKRSFSDTMEEAKQLWQKIIESKQETGRKMIGEIITSVFGKEIQLSKATEEQQDLVELVIEEMKKI